MKSPHQVTRDFEAALCEYTGAPFAVTTTSCTMALLLAVAWHLRGDVMAGRGRGDWSSLPQIEIPKRTYVSVPMSIVHAGARPTFRDESWVGGYQLKPLPVWDCARWFSSGMYRGEHPTRPWLKRDRAGQMVCVSFHWSKTLGLQQGGAILHDDQEADKWLRRARFDGRAEGVTPKDDVFTFAGWHCYMSPEVAALGLMRLSLLPKHNEPLPNDDYPDLSQMEVFK
jgi:dTDP-4-amino-4,6-dideoxygalactose transaminase